MSIIMELKPDRSEHVQYDFEDYFAYIRKGFISHYPNYAALSHWHDDIEFIAVLQGEMDYNINGDKVTLKTGDGLFVNARQLHNGFSDTRKECEYICILLHPLMLCFTQRIEKNYISPVLMNRSFPYRVLHASVAAEKRILDNIHTLYFNLDKETPELHIQSAFCQIWMDLYSSAPEMPQTSPGSLQLSCVKNMVKFIQDNYKKKLTLNDIALAGNVCKSKCCSLFRRYLNRTPIEYITNYRLQKSIELMTLTDMNMTEICFEVGFAGTSYYSETFRRFYGCSPTEYRAKNAK